MKAAFFDLDRTLIDRNSGNLWIRHEVAAGRLRLRDAARGTWWILRYRFGHDSSMDAAWTAAANTLRGQSEAELAARTEAWFSAQVTRHLRPGARTAIEAHRSAGDRLVLASSTSTYAGAAAVAAFGLEDAVCTSFVTKDGVFTGEIDNLAFGEGKANCVEKWAAANDVDLRKSSFYTDSITDLCLLDRVGRPVCIAPDRKLAQVAAERGWPTHDWGVP